MPGATDYHLLVGRREAFPKRQYDGRVVIRRDDRPMHATGQGFLRYYRNVNYDDTCLPEWSIKIQVIPDLRAASPPGQRSDLALDSRGATEMDGVLEDWEEGDLVILPQRAESVAHQHFNWTPGESARWSLTPTISCTTTGDR
jgi:hypothetical protein